MVRGEKCFPLVHLAAPLGTPACKISACWWELPWAFETQHREARSHKGSECKGSSVLRNAEYLRRKKSLLESFIISCLLSLLWQDTQADDEWLFAVLAL